MLFWVALANHIWGYVRQGSHHTLMGNKFPDIIIIACGVKDVWSLAKTVLKYVLIKFNHETRHPKDYLRYGSDEMILAVYCITVSGKGRKGVNQVFKIWPLMDSQSDIFNKRD